MGAVLSWGLGVVALWLAIGNSGRVSADEGEALEAYQDILLDKSADLFRTWQKVHPRLQVGSRGVIGGEFGDANLSWARTGGRLSLYVPVTKDWALVPRISGDITHFSFGGEEKFLDTGRVGEPFGDLIGIHFRVDSRYALDDRWGVVAGVFLSSDFEDGASFGSGRRVGGDIGISFRSSEAFKLMVGVGFREKLTRDSVSVAPYLQGSWRVNPWFEIETEGLGLRATAKLQPAIRLFAFGGLRSDRYRLRERNDGPSGAGAGSLRDRRALVGLGIEWKVWKRVRIELDSGALVWQQLKVIDEDNDKFDTQTLDGPAATLALRAELRF